jgi:hypothetical protein
MENDERDVKDMKRIKGKSRLIEGIYITILVLLYALIICIPYLVANNALLKNNVFIEAEFIEGFLITILLVITYFISIRYRKELDNYRSHIKDLSVKNADVESRLSDAFKYIGAVNVQVNEIQSLFSSLKKYPKDKKDFKNSFRFLAEKVLCVVNVDWVIFRIINVDSLRTVREYSETRGKAILLKHNISNKSIVTAEAMDGCSIVSSDQSNLTIKVFCIIPSEALTTTQKNLIKTIVNALEMLFIVFTSQYYRKSYFKQKAFDNGGLMQEM